MFNTRAIFGVLLSITTCLHHAVAQAPANDICNAATVVASTPFNSNSISTSMATSDVNTNICNVAATDVGVWYSFLGNDKIVQIVLTDSTFNAKIALFSGPCNNPVCVDNSGSTDILNFPATLNVPYLILISGVSQSKGTFNLAITDVARPPNDSCENAVAIISNDTPKGYDTIGAFPDFTAIETCTVENDVRGVWFKFTPLNDRIVTVKTSAGTFPHRIAIFTGATCGNIGCFRNIGSGSYITLPITWDAKAGQQYYILVTGSSDFSHVGTFTIAITDVARPPNDSCENAVAIISNDTPMGYNTIGAFSDFTVPLTCSVNDEVRGVWFKFTPLNDRIVTVKTSAGTFPHRIAIFTGATCGNIGCSRNIGSGSYITLPITWDVKAGQQYYILVTGSSDFSHVGTFTIAITDIPRPKNDDCVSAIEIVGSNTTKNGDTSGSFSDLIIGPQCTISANGRGIWYFFVGGGGTVRAEISDAVFNAKLIVFSGSCSNVGCVGNNDGSSNTAVVTFPTMIGVKYYLLVTGNDFDDTGTFVLKVSGDVKGPTTSPTLPPMIPVPVAPTPTTPVVTVPTPVVAPVPAPSGFFRRLFRRLFGWIDF